MCINKTPNSSITEYQKDVCGKAFSLDLVAVGQRSGTVISFVEARLKIKTESQGEIEGHINNRQKVQIVQCNCTTLKYTIILDHSEGTLMICPIKKGNFPKFNNDQLQKYPDDAILFQKFLV